MPGEPECFADCLGVCAIRAVHGALWCVYLAHTLLQCFAGSTAGAGTQAAASGLDAHVAGTGNALLLTSADFSSNAGPTCQLFAAMASLVLTTAARIIATAQQAGRGVKRAASPSDTSEPAAPKPFAPVSALRRDVSGPVPQPLLPNPNATIQVHASFTHIQIMSHHVHRWRALLERGKRFLCTVLSQC
jgi:hypothetical protein